MIINNFITIIKIIEEIKDKFPHIDLFEDKLQDHEDFILDYFHFAQTLPDDIVMRDFNMHSNASIITNIQ